MTNQEMTEIFSVLMLAWPNAEMFKGGIQKLGPTIKLWAVCLADVDYWTGQQAAIRVCKTCKFPPSIAEMRQAVDALNREMRSEIDNAFLAVRNEIMMCGGDLEKAYQLLPPIAKRVIDEMGGMERFAPQDAPMYNSADFSNAYERMLRHSAKELPIPSGGRKGLA